MSRKVLSRCAWPTAECISPARTIATFLSGSVLLDAAADAGSVGRAARHQSAAEGRRLLAVGVERGLKTRQRPVALGQPDAVDREVVHEPRVELLRRVPVRAHA